MFVEADDFRGHASSVAQMNVAQLAHTDGRALRFNRQAGYANHPPAAGREVNVVKTGSECVQLQQRHGLCILR